MPESSVSQKRNILFLQGPLSPLFSRLGTALKDKGCSVYRVNFCVGDWIHWHGDNSFSFKGKVGDWAAYFERIIAEYSITDLVLHGDRRIYHKIAIKIAKQKGIYIAVTELGILRPGMLTIEADGLGILSHFPNDPQYIMDRAAMLPEPFDGTKYTYPFAQEAFWIVSYNLFNYFLFWFYPGYRPHTRYNPILEYSWSALRLLRQRSTKRRAEKTIKKLVDTNAQYYVFPLQLNDDFQIRDYSPFDSMAEAIEVVLKSFSEHAPGYSQILVKQHPLDSGFNNLKLVTLKTASRMNVADRVLYIDGGDLKLAYKYSCGAVMVNSSAAIDALDQGIPVKNLAPAIYDMPGITFQGSLDEFWQTEVKPAKDIYSALIKVLKHSTQVPGALYGEEALDSAANNMSEKIIHKKLNQPVAYVQQPPRLSGNENWFKY